MIKGLVRFFSMEAKKLDKFGRPLPELQGGYYKPSLTTDAVVIRENSEGYHDILMVTRGREPYQGRLAFPGGFVDYNEDPLQGCLRELEEECGVVGSSPTLLTVSGDPLRDPRGHVVSIIYKVVIPADSQIKAGDDASHAQFYSVRELLSSPENIAFDHTEIIKQAIESIGQAEKYGIS